jgi:hypothetical protein
VASQITTVLKIVKTCGRIGGIFDRTVVTSGKTTATYERTDRTFGRTKEPSVVTGNNCSRMNDRGRVLDNSNRTGKISGPTAKTSEGIAGTSGLIARIGGRIFATFDRIEEISTMIGRIREQTAERPEAIIHSGQAASGKTLSHV